MPDQITETSIGIEIEINRFTDKLRSSFDPKLWKSDNEHCGVELRSVPCRGPVEIKKIINSIAKMQKVAGKCGFDNAGTHIHIDFIPPPKQDNPRKAEDLTTIDSSTIDKYWCEDCDEWHEEDDPQYPFGPDVKKYFLDKKSGKYFQTPEDYIRAWRPKKEKGKNIYRSEKKSHEHIVRSVKRFMTIGVRFAPVLFAIQLPERRLNKYCHTIQYWDEKYLDSCKSIAQICEHPALLKKHRRHMFNPLSFSKFGTVEVRMIHASFDYKEIWTQIFLFGKLAKLAKSDNEIPKSTGNAAADFVNLMGAAGIRGKARRRLSDMIKSREATVATCRCYICYNASKSPDFYHVGLSRTICIGCYNKYYWCCYCGIRQNKNDGHTMVKVSKRGNPGGRWACANCAKDSKRKTFQKTESKYKSKYFMGSLIPLTGIAVHGAPIKPVL